MKTPVNTKTIIDKTVDCFCHVPLYESVTFSGLCTQCLTREEQDEANRNPCYFQCFVKELKQRKIKHKIISSESAFVTEHSPQRVISFYRYEGRKIGNPDRLHRLEIADHVLEEILEKYPQAGAIYYNGRNLIILNGGDVLFVKLGTLEVVEALPAYSKEAAKKCKGVMLAWPDDLHDEDEYNPFDLLTIRDLVMIKINEKPGISHSELTALIDGGIHNPSTIHKALAKLMNEGLIKREGKAPYQYFPIDFDNDKREDHPTYVY